MLICAKYIVIIYNFIFWLIGVAILGFSLLIYHESHAYVNFQDTASLFDTPFILIMALGAIMTLVGFLGCCGAIRESTCLLGTYIFLCLTMGAACGASVWWGHTYGDTVREKLKADLTSVITNSYKDGSVGPSQLVIDAIQKDMQCCGANNYMDWASSVYNNNNSSKPAIGPGFANIRGSSFNVPASCCKKDATNCESARRGVTESNFGTKSKDLNSEGCFMRLDNYVKDKWSYVIKIGLVLVGCQIFALLLTCCLCCAVSKKDRSL